MSPRETPWCVCVTLWGGAVLWRSYSIPRYKRQSLKYSVTHYHPSLSHPISPVAAIALVIATYGMTEGLVLGVFSAALTFTLQVYCYTLFMLFLFMEYGKFISFVFYNLCCFRYNFW